MSSISTGPRTTEGKSVVAANALQHGIFARSPAIVGKNSFAFSDLKDALLLRFQPATPEEVSPCEQDPRLRHRSQRLVLERRAQLEVQIWGNNVSALAGDRNYPLAVAYQRNHARLTHLQHRVDSADRAYRRNLEFLIKLQAARLKVVTPTPPEPEAISQPQSPETLAPEIGFVPANSISGLTAPLPNHVPGLDGQYLNGALSEGTDGTTGVKDSSTQDSDTTQTGVGRST
jgi:hypothetical protein